MRHHTLFERLLWGSDTLDRMAAVAGWHADIAAMTRPDLSGIERMEAVVNHVAAHEAFIRARGRRDALAHRRGTRSVAVALLGRHARDEARRAS
jgi:hypothetical protein